MRVLVRVSECDCGHACLYPHMCMRVRVYVGVRIRMSVCASVRVNVLVIIGVRACCEYARTTVRVFVWMSARNCVRVYM